MSVASTLESLIQSELAVDRAADDVTCALLGQAGRRPARARVLAKAPGVFSGAQVASALEAALAGRVRLLEAAAEGALFRVGDSVVELEGTAALLLSVERTLLNFLGPLCGVATETRAFVEAVRPHPTIILATRKTLPGLRDLQLQAVVAGGGRVHRRSLSDGILIKENHQALVPGPQLIRRARETRSPLHRVEIEVQDLAGLDAVLECQPDVIMLDNLGLDQMVEAVGRIGGACEIEVSGGVRLEQAAAIAALGVNYISVGRITHSAPCRDLSLELVT